LAWREVGVLLEQAADEAVRVGAGTTFWMVDEFDGVRGALEAGGFGCGRPSGELLVAVGLEAVETLVEVAHAITCSGSRAPYRVSAARTVSKNHDGRLSWATKATMPACGSVSPFSVSHLAGSRQLDARIPPQFEVGDRAPPHPASPWHGTCATLILQAEVVTAFSPETTRTSPSATTD
jgi:hypothetical protein